MQRYPTNPVYGSQHQSPYSPPPQNFPFGDAPGTVPARSNGRSRSLTQGPTYRNRSANGTAHSQRLPPLQTSAFPLDFPMQPPSAYNLMNPYLDPDLLRGVMLQIEYYFSVTNLCRDNYLRERMDSQGFVPLLEIADFPRVKALAPTLDFVRCACESSEELEYVVDENVELIRARVNWDKFVMPEDRRIESARKAGPNLNNPTVFFRSNYRRAMQPFAHGIVASAYQTSTPASYATGFPMNGAEQMYQMYTNGGPIAPSVNGTDINGHVYAGDSQLSAAVPDFSPRGMMLGAPTTLEDYQNCPDDQVDKLVIMVKSNPDKARQVPSRSGEAAERGGGSGSAGDASRYGEPTYHQPP